ncbi:MAG: aldolase/citrate lyase family protein [Gaiellaceae bacterium]
MRPPSPNDRFELALFATDLAVVRQAVAGGVEAVVVDWESEGKEARQASHDTEINRHTVADLRAARTATRARLLCRINCFGARTAQEVEQALAAGADELLLPMVRSPAEVESVLVLADGRSGVGILVETRAAVEVAAELARLPVSRVYVGLNDLAIERGTPSIFAPLADGLLDELRERFAAVRFGFGGLTLPEAGSPLPCRLLVAEIARLRADFTFLRRSFYRDVAGRDVAREVPRILAALAAARQRPTEEEERDRSELLARLLPRATQAALA